MASSELEHRRSQFGPTLRTFIFYQYFSNQVTEPCLLKQLGGIQIFSRLNFLNIIRRPF